MLSLFQKPSLASWIAPTVIAPQAVPGADTMRSLVAHPLVLPDEIVNVWNRFAAAQST